MATPTNDFIGALVMNSVEMNGHFSFHYDEALNGITHVAAFSALDHPPTAEPQNVIVNQPATFAVSVVGSLRL